MAIINGKKVELFSFKDTGHLFDSIPFVKGKLFVVECHCDYPNGPISQNNIVLTTLGLCDVCKWTPWVVFPREE